MSVSFICIELFCGILMCILSTKMNVCYISMWFEVTSGNAWDTVDVYIYKQNLCLKHHKFEGSQNGGEKDACRWMSDQREGNQEWVREAKKWTVYLRLMHSYDKCGIFLVITSMQNSWNLLTFFFVRCDLQCLSLCIKTSFLP